MEDIHKSFAAIASRFPKLRAACEKRVARWEWWKGIGAPYELEPYRSESRQLPKAKRADKPLPKRDGNHQVGLDADDRPVVRRCFYSRVSYDEELFTYGSDAIDLLALSYQKQPLHAVRYDLDRDGNITRRMLADGNVTTEHAYKYDAGRIARIRYKQSGEASWSWSYEVTHDPLGRLQSITRGGKTLYSRPKKGETVASLLSLVEERLLSEIPRVLARARIREEVWCLGLVYSLEDGVVLPPRLALGRTKERGTWDPIEWKLFDVRPLLLKDPALLRASEELNRRFSSGGSDRAGRAMLHHVARALPRARLARALRTTRDFGVVAIHGELKRLEEDLRKSGWK